MMRVASSFGTSSVRDERRVIETLESCQNSVMLATIEVEVYFKKCSCGTFNRNIYKLIIIVISTIGTNLGRDEQLYFGNKNKHFHWFQS